MLGGNLNLIDRLCFVNRLGITLADNLARIAFTALDRVWVESYPDQVKEFVIRDERALLPSVE